MKRFMAFALTCSLLVGLLSGCATGTGGEPPSSLPQDPEDSVTGAIDDGFGMPYTDDGFFDPLTTGSALNIYLTPLIYQSLFVRGADMSFSPQLAEATDLSGTMLRVTLRGDVIFHNGTLLTAEDVVYSFTRIQNAEGSAYYDEITPILSCSADGSRTVVFTLAEETIDWQAALTFPVIRRGTGAKSDAEGSGAYALRIAEGERYLSAVGGDSRPQDLPFARIDLIAVKNLSGMVEAFEAGVVDCMAVDVLSVESFMPVCSYSIQSAETGLANLLLFNTDSKALSRADVRAALSFLLPRADLCASALSGAAQPSADWVYGGTVPNTSVMDRDAALSILSDAGLTAGETSSALLLVYCKDLWQREEEARQIAAALAKLGIACELQGLSNEDYIAAMDKWQFDLCILRRELCSPVDLAEMVCAGAEANYTGYHNADMEAELNVLLYASEDTAAEAAGEVSRMLSADAPFAVIGYESIRVYFRDGRITNFAPLPDSPYGNPVEWGISG